MTTRPFDAVLLVAFGGPQGPDDIRPFLANVLRGRRVRPERIEEVAHHYELFGGVSPLTELTMRAGGGARATLRARGLPLPVHVGMRNWTPYLADTLEQMSRRRRAPRDRRPCRGAAQLFGLHAISRERPRRARRAGREQAWRRSASPTSATGTSIPASSRPTPITSAQAFGRLPPESPRRRAADLHRAQHPDLDGGALSVRSAAARRGRADRRRGRPQLTGRSSIRAAADVPATPGWSRTSATTSGGSTRNGLDAAVLCPVGFLCDHVEVLYDLDVEAAEVCRETRHRDGARAAVNAPPAVHRRARRRRHSTSGGLRTRSALPDGHASAAIGDPRWDL